jgi:LysM repeat protein
VDFETHKKPKIICDEGSFHDQVRDMTPLTYVVQSGDTLSEIAKRYKVNPQDLFQINAIKDPALIWIGQKLEIPTKEQPTGVGPIQIMTYPQSAEPENFRLCTQYPSSLEQFLKASLVADNMEGGLPNQCVHACTVNPTCQISGMIISCGHTDRRFKLEVPENGQEPKDGYIFEVIAGENTVTAEVLKIEFAGNCGLGMQSNSSLSTDITLDNRPNTTGCCPTVVVSGPGVQVDQPTLVKVNVYAASPPSMQDNFKTFLQQILIPYKVERRTYQITPRVCAGTSAPIVRVNAYPQAEWEGALSIGYFHAPHKDSNFNRTQGYRNLKVNGEWKAEGKITAKYASHIWEWGGEVGGQGVHQDSNFITRQLFERAQNFLDTVTPFLGSIKTKYGSIAIDWPKLTLSGGMKNYEKPDGYEVDIEGSIKIAFAPLIGAKFTINILEWLILMFSGTLSEFLIDVKESAAREIGADQSVGARAVVFVNLNVDGNVGGTMEWKKNDSWSCQGTVEAGMGFEIEAKVELEGKVFMVVAGAGAGIALKGADKKKSTITGKLIATDTEGQPGTRGKIDFNGLAIFYSLYAYVGLKETKTNSKARATSANTGFWGGMKSATLKNERKEEKLYYELCKPKTLLDTKDQIV